MDFEAAVKTAVKNCASDIFLIAGQPVSYKCRREIYHLGEDILTDGEAEAVINGIYEMCGRSPRHYQETGDDDFAFSMAFKSG